MDMDLKPFNTFGVSVQASNFSIIRKESEIPENLENTLVIGEGANILFTKDTNASLKLQVQNPQRHKPLAGAEMRVL